MLVIHQKYLEEDVEQMLGDCIENGVRIVVDSNPLLVQNLLKFKPFMIKTTPNELAQIVNKECNDLDSIQKAALEVHDHGARYVMVVIDNRQAILVCRQGTYQVNLNIDESYISFVGTADSLVAGFLMNYLRTKDPLDSFRFGASCGAATAYSKGLATRNKIDSFYETTEVNKIA